MQPESHSGPRIIWVGFHEEGALCIPALYEAGFQINAIVTLDEVELRKRSGIHDFQPLAERYAIPLFTVSHINDASSIELLKDLQPEVIFVIGWSQILNAEALACAPIVLGTHASHSTLKPDSRNATI